MATSTSPWSRSRCTSNSTVELGAVPPRTAVRSRSIERKGWRRALTIRCGAASTQSVEMSDGS